MTALLVFPHQLFEEILHTDPARMEVILIEDDLFFTQYRFHRQKLVLHRASMVRFASDLKARGFSVSVITTGSTQSMIQLSDHLSKKKITDIQHYELVDDWLGQRLATVIEQTGVSVERLPSPSFLTTRGQLDEYRRDNPLRMQQFYQWQRKRLNLLMDKDGQPQGGKWSFDESNRKKLPKGTAVPPAYHTETDSDITEAIQWVDKTFPDNPGTAATFAYPITHAQAIDRLQQFLERRFADFGPYEDAIQSDQSELFHSVLSSSLNCGLITPHEVVERTIAYAHKYDISVESLEGFIRQIIGWREYMRATYVWKGRSMRTKNTLDVHRAIPKSWWTGEVGVTPIDDVIKRVLDTGYAHHIERLMVLGNSMLLLRFDPDQVYEWFMSLFIDAYDWVMVPNIYAMSQYAAGDLITTKPYISGSNYLIKMSDYKKDEWATIWDAWYWQFIDDYRELFESNYRSSMMVKLYERLSDERRASIKNISHDWLT